MTDEEKIAFSKIITELCNDFRFTIQKFNKKYWPEVMSAKDVDIVKNKKLMVEFMRSSEATLRALSFELGYTKESLRSIPQEIVHSTIAEEIKLGQNQFLREGGELDETTTDEYNKALN